MKPKIVAIVPARAGSKGLPGKNVRNLCGRPLYRYSVDAALGAGIDEVIISTDIDEIFSHVLPEGVIPFRRPSQLAGDDSMMNQVLLDLLEERDFSNCTLVLLQPTSPLRKPHHILQGLNMFSTGDWSLVMSVCAAPSSVLKWGQTDGDRFLPLSEPSYCFANRQSLPAVFKPNGALYVFNADAFRERGNFITDAIGVVRMEQAESLDVDTLEDFVQCERMLEQGELNV